MTIVDKFKNIIYNWFITLTDVCNQFGMDALAFKRDKHLEERLKGIFENVDIKVYIIESKLVYDYSMPGQIIMSNPFILKIRGLPDWILPGILTTVDIILGLFGTFEEIIRGSIIFKHNNHLQYNPDTKKFKLGFDKATVYITRGMCNILEDEDQIISILLEDVGYNTMILYDGILDMMSTGFATLLYSITGIKFYKMFTSGLNNIFDTLKTYFSLIFIYIIVIRTILIYYRRRQFVSSAEFIVKCGYGNHYYEACKKIHKYIYDLKNMSQKNLNIIDKILLTFRRVIGLFYELISKTGLIDHIESSKIRDMVKSKIKNYKSKLKNNIIDRTDRIDDNAVIIPSSPVLKTIDKIHNKYIQPMVDKL